MRRRGHPAQGPRRVARCAGHSSRICRGGASASGRSTASRCSSNSCGIGPRRPGSATGSVFLARGSATVGAAYARCAGLASRVEPYGMVVTEALARGLPVIATAVGGLPRLWDGPTMAADPACWCRPMTAVRWRPRCATGWSTPILRQRLREAARERRSSLGDVSPPGRGRCGRRWGVHRGHRLGLGTARSDGFASTQVVGRIGFDTVGGSFPGLGFPPIGRRRERSQSQYVRGAGLTEYRVRGIGRAAAVAGHRGSSCNWCSAGSFPSGCLGLWFGWGV